MRREDFENQLMAACFRALVFGQKFVTNRLSPNLTFIVVLNQSNDGDKAQDEDVYPEDSGRIEECAHPAAVVDLLFRKEKCPQWIDISAVGSDRSLTLIRLICCGRYQKNEEKLYYHGSGTQPFGIKGPVMLQWPKPNEKRTLPSVKVAQKAIRSGQTPMTFLDKLRTEFGRRKLDYDLAVEKALRNHPKKN